MPGRLAAEPGRGVRRYRRQATERRGL